MCPESAPSSEVHGWEITTTILVGLLLIVAIVFSVLRPNSRIRLGVFLERESRRDKTVEEDTQEWPTQKH